MNLITYSNNELNCMSVYKLKKKPDQNSFPIFNNIYPYTVTNGGGTVNLDVTDSTTTRYIFSGTATLSSSLTIQPTGTAVQGMEFDIRWQAAVTIGSNSVTIFGTTLTGDLECCSK